MDRCTTALAILAICVSGALSIPQEADPINVKYGNGDVSIDCEGGEWGPCSATCGKGRQVIQLKKKKHSLAMYILYI